MQDVANNVNVIIFPTNGSTTQGQRGNKSQNEEVKRLRAQVNDLRKQLGMDKESFQSSYNPSSVQTMNSSQMDLTSNVGSEVSKFST